jgi:hypothetical protein
MRVTMMLADHAQVADGKLFIAGGGLSMAGPGPTPCALALLFHVPWQRAGERIDFTLNLIDEDGHPVIQGGPEGPTAVQVSGHFETVIPPDTPPGDEITVPVAFGSMLHLPPGRRYTWVLEVDGEGEDTWRLSFATRQDQATATG